LPHISLSISVSLTFCLFLTPKNGAHKLSFLWVCLCIPRPALSLSLFFSQPPSFSPSLCFVYYVLGLYFMCWLPPVSLFMAFNPTRATNHPPPNHPLTHPATHWNCFIQPDTQTHAHTHKHLHSASVYACALIFCRQIFCSI